ncbi:hypothetical protein, partial [Thiolapillus sp.]
MLGKKKKSETPKQVTTPPPAGGKPHPILYYFIPVLFIAAVAAAALVFVQSWLSERYAAGKLQDAARFAAVTMQHYAASVVNGKADLVKITAGSLRVRQTLTGSEEELMRMGKSLQKKLPGALWVKLLPTRGWDDEKVQKALMGSFAAAEMYQQVREQGKMMPAEALKDASGRSYFLLAAPVRNTEKPVGVLFAAFPMKLIAGGLQGFSSENISLVLEQDKNMPLVSAGA